MLGAIDQGTERPLLRVYMRYRRESLGLTQQDVAKRMFISLSLYRKLEKGERPLTGSRLEDWCRAMDAPVWLMEKMATLALPGISTIAVGKWPPVLSQEDLDHLECFPFPAFYHKFPEYEVLAANQVAREAFPWLHPAPPEAERPTNVIEQMASVPEARASLINWYEIVHRLVYILKTSAPGIADPVRLAQILETCRREIPEFETMWNTEMDEETYNRATALVRTPDGSRLAFTMRSYNSWHPNDRQYQLFMLTPARLPDEP